MLSGPGEIRAHQGGQVGGAVSSEHGWLLPGCGFVENMSLKRMEVLAKDHTTGWRLNWELNSTSPDQSQYTLYCLPPAPVKCKLHT